MGSCLVSTASEFMEATATFLQASTPSDSFVRFMGTAEVVTLSGVATGVAVAAEAVISKIREKSVRVRIRVGGVVAVRVEKEDESHRADIIFRATTGTAHHSFHHFSFPIPHSQLKNARSLSVRCKITSHVRRTKSIMAFSGHAFLC